MLQAEALAYSKLIHAFVHAHECTHRHRHTHTQTEGGGEIIKINLKKVSTLC